MNKLLLNTRLFLYNEVHDQGFATVAVASSGEEVDYE